MSRKKRIIIDGKQYEKQRNLSAEANKTHTSNHRTVADEYNRTQQFVPFSTYMEQQSFQNANDRNEKKSENERANGKYMTREEALKTSEQSKPNTPYDEVSHSGPVSDHLQSFYNEAYINERERLNAMFGRLDVYPITPKEKIIYAEPDLTNYVPMAKYKKVKKGLKILGIAFLCAIIIATVFALIAFHVFG